MCTNHQQMEICWFHLLPWSTEISFTPEHFSRINRLSFPHLCFLSNKFSIERLLNFCDMKIISIGDSRTFQNVAILEDPLRQFKHLLLFKAIFKKFIYVAVFK